MEARAEGGVIHACDGDVRDLFAVPTLIEDDVSHQEGVQRVGVAEGILQSFYAVSAERRLGHPLVAAMRDAAKKNLV